MPCEVVSPALVKFLTFIHPQYASFDKNVLSLLQLFGLQGLPKNQLLWTVLLPVTYYAFNICLLGRLSASRWLLKNMPKRNYLFPFICIKFHQIPNFVFNQYWETGSEMMLSLEKLTWMNGKQMSVMRKFMFIRNYLTFDSYSLQRWCKLESWASVYTFLLDVCLIWNYCLVSEMLSLLGMSCLYVDWRAN